MKHTPPLWLAAIPNGAAAPAGADGRPIYRFAGRRNGNILYVSFAAGAREQMYHNNLGA